MYAQNQASIYARNDVETGVAAATPHKLVLMLFDGAIRSINDAVGQIQRGEAENKGRSITRAVQIIDEGLRASLDIESGGEIAQHLFDLYVYMTKRLLVANLRSDVPILQEVRRLLSDLRVSWAQIEGTAAPAAPGPGRAASLSV